MSRGTNLLQRQAQWEHQCRLTGLAAQSASLLVHHTKSACDFTFSDEILNDLAPERAAWYQMSAPGWKYAAEDLSVASKNYTLSQCARDAAEKEMRLKTLVLLYRIVSTHTELTCEVFLARFAGETSEDCEANMELFLRIAMVQGITPQSKLHRDWTWNLFDSTQLTEPIPGFNNTYHFYEAYDQELASNPQFQRLGFFLVPRPSDLLILTLNDGTTLYCGVSGSHMRNRFMQEVFLKENISLPPAYQNLDFIRSLSSAFEDDHLGLLSELKKFFNYAGPSSTQEAGPSLPDSLIPIEKGDTPAPMGEDFMDLEAVKSSGSGSGSDSSSEESDVDMPEAKPQGNVDSSSDNEESESGEGAEEGEAKDDESEEGSDNE
ncbi:hypothetical protein DFH08DRAFT_822252 [Mycena albidolilacea]|uniref:Uncharacterized protein n=1 Tax=Mycena albidolilacea TaxID=1033008 RepID=A0AAD6Z9L4_9AGAR|nr:hypothetical protein DFH08DRAFT_822252 [Mycena albidolilacea]